eukprot:TRINITY_DN63121_c0_g1_i1.p1 TRINITY_DN63121_c0_g1~~TRINITY_DN63121_c0_g1_i1.p1  ORF type:complete len:167 (-),score=31.36 TRINITY_DN63121_c0_g1_i1:92-592(-)
MSRDDRSRSPPRGQHGGGAPAWAGGGGGGYNPAMGTGVYPPQRQFMTPAGAANFSGVRPPAGVSGVMGAAGFTGVRTMGPGPGMGGGGGYGGPSRAEQSGPPDPLDAYMASVHRELDRTTKGKKKNKVGDVASAREAFGPQAMQKLRPGGFEARDTDTLMEDKLLR